MRRIGALLIAVGLLAASPTVVARAQQSAPANRPLTTDDFEYAAPRGFGDLNNGWAQSMAWWQDALYVGTARQPVCTSFFAIWNFVRIVISQEFADTYLPYPPRDPGLSCEPVGADLPLQAEIWRWPAATGVWQRVFQSPLELDNPGPGSGEPPLPGKKLPYEISFRGLTPHTDPDGTEALYAFGVNSTVMWDSTQLPPPRILRTTDGFNFEPLPQTPGTFLGDLPHNPDHSSFRSPESFNGKLFVISGPIFGQGSLIASADPAQGDDAWFLASPPEIRFYEMEAFNGWLYLGTLDVFAGYSIVKTRAEGAPPYEFVTVIPSGAGVLEGPSRSAVSMREYDGRLYVGTATKTEIVRINTDDTWDLVLGPPREIQLPSGELEWKYPISGLDAGFGHTLNDHAWQMVEVDGSLYIGTYTVGTWYRNDPLHGPSLQHNLGAHLYRTDDGWYYSAVTTDGFADLGDPLGGRYDYGIRTMASTPYGTFIGTANDFHGLAILRAESNTDSAPDSGTEPVCDCASGSNPGADSHVDPADRLEVETTSGGPLLSWRPPRSARSRVYRAEVHPISIREDLNYFGDSWNVLNGTFRVIPDTFVGPYEEIATVEHCSVRVDDLVITASAEFVALSTLSSANTRIVAQGLVEYRAGESIVLENGFSVERGSFQAILDGDVDQTLSFVDSTVESEKSYMYYVVAETCSGVSEPSNLVTYPSLTPVITFARLLTEVARRLDPPTRGIVSAQVVAARDLAADCRIREAIEALELLQTDPALVGLQAGDIRILIAKLARRLTLFGGHPQEVLSDEFCSSSPPGTG